MLKKVNIMCHRPFKCRYAMFSGRILGAVLDTKIIQFALLRKQCPDPPNYIPLTYFRFQEFFPEK